MILKINLPGEGLSSVDSSDKYFLDIQDKKGNVVGAITLGDLQQQLKQFGITVTKQ